MSFRDMVSNDIQTVFLNDNEFAERRIVKYDGETYAGDDGNGISVVLSNIKERDRHQTVQDHAAGLYIVSQTLHCDLADLNGVKPEKGMRLEINDAEGSSYFQRFIVAQRGDEMGMLRIELEAYDE